MGFFVFLLMILLLFILYVYYKLNYWKRLKIPYVEPEFFYGNSRGIDEYFPNTTFFRDMYLKFKSKGSVFGVYLFTEPYLIVTDLDLIKTILIKDFKTFPTRGSYYNEEDDPASANITNLSGEKWKNLRNKLTPTFTNGKLKMMFSIICEVADKLVEQINATGHVEVENLLSRFGNDVIGEIAFGIECNSLKDPENDFYKMAIKSFPRRNFLSRIFTSNYPNLARKLHIRATPKEPTEFYKNVLEQTIKYREENKINRNDFIGFAMDTWKTDNPLTFNDIWGTAYDFFRGSHGTTTIALTYVLYELAQHHLIQQKARECAKKAVEKFNGEFSFEAIAEMEYIEQCVKEALRKYPPSIATKRVACENFKIPESKIVLEKGTNIIIPIFGIHRDPEIFESPSQFIPDRFSPENISSRHNFAFIPFGKGARNCIAYRFAMLLLKLSLAKILVNFEFNLDRKKTSVPMKFAKFQMLLKPNEKIFINFNKI